ncbi:CoB--CoM heterodisulfide reductase subunit B [Rhodovastum atsumiense]|uniref:Heterodisulfide reductase, subunit B n=1 Tax=Rhodovastum atsumiense TaxID=504468 RepID=A0A5M6IKH4_9PROT|nr:CoB--CoM heterodisulfide reductase iron-sulfur subunit B family protein [Rhodovastum atsumiense]KAA5608750.1 heterodisulfide reductase, subunit B [Rhodovastum atsumiense]CAH2603041.1 CoB--CoM heterodisulfide reductase subunit B [Rhodovastum atsumiense]
MKLSYYPGCTMKNRAGNFEESILFSMKKLGVEIEELERWNCCGTVLSLSEDDAMRQLAPVRTMIRVKEANASRVMTACSMCYNTLKRANDRVKADPALLKRMNVFMADEAVDYEGDVEVVHTLEILRELKAGTKLISDMVGKPLKGLRVASYYGCLLVRPRSIAFDNVEDPVLLDELVRMLGGTTIEWSYKTECCGAYQTVDKPKVVADRTYRILSDAREQGAEMVAVSCPLCAFNLDHRQEITRSMYPDFEAIPIVYFTQLMAIAFGCAESVLKLDLHYNSPRPVLAERGLL